MARGPATFLVSLAAFIAVGFTALATFNWIVDPYGITGALRIDRFNVEKPARFANGGRATRAYVLASEPFDVLLFGSSRTMVGLDPESVHFQGQRVFNAGVPGTNMFETARIIDFALARQAPSRIVIGLDFLMFSTARETSGDFALSGFAGLPRWQVYGRSLVSFNGLSDSITTVEANFAGARSGQLASGHVDRRIDMPESYNWRRTIERTLRGNFLTPPDTYGAYQYDPARVDALSGAVAQACARGIETDIFITPIHAWQLETIALLGLWDAFEQWERDLTIAVATHSCAHLWDFAGYSTITTEPVPADGVTTMSGYFETSHFFPWVGDAILARMAGEGTDGFGVALTPDGIETHLAALRAAREIYEAHHEEDMAALRELVAETEEEREARRQVFIGRPPN